MDILDYLNILDYDTGETRQLDFPGVTAFAWSPDGQQIAFTTEPETQGNHYLPTDPITGSAPYYLFGMSVADLQPAPIIQLPSKMRAYDIEWLPGGDKILTLCQPGGTESYALLYPFLGYSQETVTDEYDVLADLSIDIKFVRDIAVEPTGRRVAITSWNDADANVITLVSTKVSSTATITVDVPVGSIDWSPDGKLLAFTTVPGGQSGLFVITVFGNTSADIAPPWEYAYNPAFSPDSAYLAYLTATSDVETMGYALNVYSFATGDSTQIVPAHVSLWQPVWRP